MIGHSVCRTKLRILSVLVTQSVDVLTLMPPSPGDDRPQIAPVSVPVAEVEPLRAELESFLAAARGEHPPVVPGEDGRRALLVATRVLESIREHALKAGITF